MLKGDGCFLEHVSLAGNSTFILSEKAVFRTRTARELVTYRPASFILGTAEFYIISVITFSP